MLQTSQSKHHQARKKNFRSQQMRKDVNLDRVTSCVMRHGAGRCDLSADIHEYTTVWLRPQAYLAVCLEGGFHYCYLITVAILLSCFSRLLLCCANKADLQNHMTGLL